MTALEFLLSSLLEKKDMEGFRRELNRFVSFEIERKWKGLEPIGLFGMHVPAGKIANGHVRPFPLESNNSRQLKALILPEDVATKFELMEAFVGKNSVFSSTESIPCEAFSDSGRIKGTRVITMPMNVPLLHSHMDFNYTVRNISDVTAHFRGVIMCEIVPDVVFVDDEELAAMVSRPKEANASLSFKEESFLLTKSQDSSVPPGDPSRLTQKTLCCGGCGREARPGMQLCAHCGGAE